MSRCASRFRISSKLSATFRTTHKSHQARNPAGFFVIMGYHKDATKRMIMVYTKGNDSNLLIVFYVQIMPD
ncbi:hypothetical protein UQ81_09140, partial [Shigella dysenteriae]